MFAIRDSSGKVVRIAVGFPGVQFERVPWYENGKVILPVLACSLVISRGRLVAAYLPAGFGRRIFLSKPPPASKQQPR